MFKVEILADSYNTMGDRLTTMCCTYPRAIHAEIMTHRTHSRNSASSRAIPSETLIKSVIDNPYIPIHWGKNQSGMQAYEELTLEEQNACKAIWLEARDDAVQHAQKLLNLGLHKQIANRILEPWMWITVIMSSSGRGWRNMFALRCHKTAEPHFQKLAYMMRDSYWASQPKQLKDGEWHLPLCGFGGDELYSDADKVKLSAARCARVSYLTHEGKREPDKDFALHDRLSAQSPKHMSSFEHQAMCCNHSRFNGNFGPGWLQYRKTIPMECAE